MEGQYYKGIDELIHEARQESNTEQGDRHTILRMKREADSADTSSRRDFLKLFGFTVASTAIAYSCKQPVEKAIPFLIRPESITPGEASYFASTFFDGIDYCSILVKVRDGRPIKIEGNELSTVTRGGTNARTQASILGLYDDTRYKEPTHHGKAVSWDEADKSVITSLENVKNKNGRIVILSSTIISPSTKATIGEFISSFPGADHIQYDAVSSAAILKANEATFGMAFIPSYNFHKAALIVSFDADFLGSWLSPIEYTKQYVRSRKLDEGQRNMSRHIHFEGGVSLTGSNADERHMMRPSQEKGALAALYNELQNLSRQTPHHAPASPADMKSVAEELWEQRGKSLVVCGSNDSESQILVNAINMLLGNYGETIDTDTHLKLRQGHDDNMEHLIADMEAGKVNCLILYDVNPAYDYHDPERFLAAMGKTELSVALSALYNETAGHAHYICPDHHYLEAWNDAEIKTGSYSLAQPVIRPVFATRPAQESLLRWAGKETGYRDYIQNYWRENIFPLSEGYASFEEFWNGRLHDGVFVAADSNRRSEGIGAPASHKTRLTREADKVLAQLTDHAADNTINLSMYVNVSAGTGRHGNNPWLHELPDPVTKICWDNYAAISPRLARELNFKDYQLVTIDGAGPLPVVIQPGQEYRTVSVALGYGRENNTNAYMANVGYNVYPLVGMRNGIRQYNKEGVKIEKAAGSRPLARTQTHHSMEGRSLIRETTLDEYLANPYSGNEIREKIKAHLSSLYQKQEFKGFHWGLAVDLNSCTGCNACVVACSAENNVPVVGREQVFKAREMHWIRIDRYYKGDPDNPEIVRQPVMCQHCDNAPCENVCPVAATTHSDEGLNQMIYNRCIGTRYCNNNCPYKVRRFNFFDYTGADAMPGNTKDPAGMTTDLRRLVLNPDVTVRARGVIEKCSFCIQRIQDKKLSAKNEGRMLRDGEVVTACAQACPADAIVFGDLNNKDSKISKFFADERNYHLLEELHTLPTVGYLTKVRNRK